MIDVVQRVDYGSCRAPEPRSLAQPGSANMRRGAEVPREMPVVLPCSRSSAIHR